MDQGRADRKIPPRAPISVQPLLWLTLAISLCVLPFVAGSQVADSARLPDTNIWVQRYSDAMDRYEAGDYASAYTQFRTLADYGSAGAQAMLGQLYTSGRGVAKSDARAAMWFHRAAERGYAPAQLALARAYRDGRGVKADKIKSGMWFNLAATRSAAAIEQPAKAELAALTAQLSPAAQNEISTRLKAWRPDVALMP
jgi:uncharacterized protein